MKKQEITEKTAQDLIKVMSQVVKNSSEQINDFAEAIVIATNNTIEFNISLCKLKIIKANIFTQWYWERRLKKAEEAKIILKESK